MHAWRTHAFTWAQYTLGVYNIRTENMSTHTQKCVLCVRACACACVRACVCCERLCLCICIYVVYTHNCVVCSLEACGGHIQFAATRSVFRLANTRGVHNYVRVKIRAPASAAIERVSRGRMDDGWRAQGFGLFCVSRASLDRPHEVADQKRCRRRR